MGKRVKKKEVPAELKDLNGFNTFEDCVMALSFLAHRDTGRKFCMKLAGHYWRATREMCEVRRNTIIRRNDLTASDKDVVLLTCKQWGSNTSDVTLLYADETGNVWESNLAVTVKDSLSDFIHTSAYAVKPTINEIEVIDFKISEWAPASSYVDSVTALLNSSNMLHEIFEAKNKYAHAFFTEKGLEAQNVDNVLMLGLMHPEFEQLSKAGYDFSEKFLLYLKKIEKSEWAAYGRLCKSGTSLKDIFKTSSSVYKPLRNESDIAVWDVFRKMEKTGKIKNSDEVVRINTFNFMNKDLSEINAILNASYDNKPVFTLQSLLNYLERLETFEAIEPREALPLLHDYLGCCQAAGIEPRVDGDSLKREHDIAARICREIRQRSFESRYDENFKAACQKLSAFDYAEGTFCIRAIRDIDDLYDEAKQQHNCLSGYIERIAEGTAKIFVMRETNNPNTSLISVSITKSSGKYILCQALKAYNQPIRNKAQYEFLNRWISHINTL